MSLRKLCVVTILTTMVGLAVIGRLNRRIKQFDLPKSKTRPHGPVFAADGPLWYRGQPTNQLLRSPNGNMLPTVFLPIQLKSAKGLGAGKLLVASRDLADPNFAETVILLVRYDAQGVIGLVLNRRTDVPLSRVLEDLKAAKNRSDPVYLGGPLGIPGVFALFQSPTKIEGTEHIFGRVYLISAKTLFEQTISTAPDPGVFHVYLGYAGWTIDQLRKEVELGAWFIFPGDASAVFNSDPDSLWSQMIRKTGLNLAESGPAGRDGRTRAGQFLDVSYER
ncbi:MAG TPA: YqgE/AlgH family protein [Terriglobales bacterium]|nr:YqgE/AlgH family protein [Terriglobales bacterium]